MILFRFDTHMHFDLYEDREAVLDRIERSQSYSIAVTNLPKLFDRYKRQIDWGKYKYTRLALGIHPELVAEHGKQIDKFIDFLKDTRFVGEVGLDFTTNDLGVRNAQREVFQRVIDECNRYGNKVLTIHTRKATQEALQVMRNFSGKAIFHWYSGPMKDLQEALERGYFFSVNQQMLKSTNGRRIVDLIPIDRLLIESDAPFTKGLEKQYSVSFMEEIYQYITVSRELDGEMLPKILKENFRNLLS